jgi:hypothetical protein
MAGEFSVTLHYTKKNVVTYTDGVPYVSVELLSGFTYPVENMSFTVTLPGTFESVPDFTAGYLQEAIEENVTYTVTGATVSGTVDGALKDHETLTMTVKMPAELFAAEKTRGNDLEFIKKGAAAALVLAALYFLLTMRFVPAFGDRQATPPEGMSAGMVGNCLVQKDADLTLMVFTWAQLGYLFIHLDNNGRVTLHKKMDMGNERSGFEQRCFRSLFSKRNSLDATGYNYARLWAKAAADTPPLRGYFRRGSGNPTLLRILCCAAAVLAGANIGDHFAVDTALRILLMLIFAAVGGICGWLVQQGGYCLHLRDKTEGIIGLAAAVVMVALGVASGEGLFTAGVVVCQILGGLAAAYGGRRTEMGQQAVRQVLGLGRYMRKVERKELIRIIRSNPGYYYQLAPYALALGVDKRLAKQFGNFRLPACTWLVTDVETARTAQEWYPLLREAAGNMDALRKRAAVEKYLPRKR